jgi:acyl-CoA synthetase (AMP-forming)/AMP-acid ligase II
MPASLAPEEFDQMVTLGDVPRHHARMRGGQVALSFEGRETTFAALDANSNRAVAALLAEGLKKGDRVCYFGKNSDHYFELLFAVMKAGAVIAPIGWRLAADEVAYIIDDAQCVLLFVGPECVEVGEAAAARALRAQRSSRWKRARMLIQLMRRGAMRIRRTIKESMSPPAIRRCCFIRQARRDGRKA